ncbi:MAG: hypothetical protein A2Z34_11475 [Planctomycetes bacterium RBG_16_59_8]|nr:MAG: hypothetical protein A2Z34_11475 [Planctomycetes bacterium RBG_16_59_8]
MYAPLRLALIGESLSGKTTLFSALSGIEYTRAVAAPGMSATIKVHEPRMRTILGVVGGPKKLVEPSLEILDARSIQFGTRQDENREILATLRECDGLVAVLKCYESELDPAGLAAAVREQSALLRTELVLADMEIIQRRMEKLEVQLKRPSPSRDADQMELQILTGVLAAVAKEDLTVFSRLTPEDEKRLRGFQFLSAKPFLAVANLSETGWTTGRPDPADATAAFPFKLEHELRAMAQEERIEFMKDYRVDRLLVEELPRKLYYAMGRVMYFTIGKNDITSWEMPRGTSAFDAAGCIHSDIQKGFIRAEVVGFDDWMKYGSVKAAADNARLKLVGKSSPIEDGDIVLFKFGGG